MRHEKKCYGQIEKTSSDQQQQQQQQQKTSEKIDKRKFIKIKNTIKKVKNLI